MNKQQALDLIAKDETVFFRKEKEKERTYCYKCGDEWLWLTNFNGSLFERIHCACVDNPNWDKSITPQVVGAWSGKPNKHYISSFPADWDCHKHI